MPDINHVDAKSGDVVLLVGTMKGAFLFSSNSQRKDWSVGGPYFPEANRGCDYYDALSQKVLDADVNKIPYEAPALTPPASLTNELGPSSISEHPTHHLNIRKS